MKYLRKLYPIVCVLALWYMASSLISTSLIPYPHIAIQTLITHGNELIGHTFASFTRIISAILISFAIGTPIGLFLGIRVRADRLISPIIYLLYPLPKIAFLPILMLLFGLGDGSKIVLMVSILVFQIIISIRDGIRLIPPSFIMLMESYHASPTQKIRHLYLPAICPQILSGLRLGLGVSIATLFFAENYATFKGLGYFIMNAWNQLNYPLMYAGIIALSLMGYLLFYCIDYLESRFTYS